MIPIAGPPSASQFRVGAWLHSRGATDLFIDVIADALWDAAVLHDIDPCVMIAHSAKETGFGRFGRACTPAHMNPCGLKIKMPAVAGHPALADDSPYAHEMFSGWDEGVQAMVDHYGAYLGRPRPRLELSARADWIRKNPPIKYVEEFGGRPAPLPNWAPSATYAVEFAAMVREMSA